MPSEKCRTTSMRHKHNADCHVTDALPIVRNIWELQVSRWYLQIRWYWLTVEWWVVNRRKRAIVFYSSPPHRKNFALLQVLVIHFILLSVHPRVRPSQVVKLKTKPSDLATFTTATPNYQRWTVSLFINQGKTNGNEYNQIGLAL